MFDFDVSIHAPVMDANTNPDSDDDVSWVSIHAPVMDANNAFVNFVAGLGFNPRARDGREKFWSIRSKRLLSFNPRARDGRERL